MLQKNSWSCSSSKQFAVQITSSSLENLRPFMNSFSFKNKNENFRQIQTLHLLALCMNFLIYLFTYIIEA